MFAFNPRNAIVHPLWWGALFLLVLNDFVLKASPFAGAVTGKLSDFAGLFIFPLFLALLFRVERKSVWLSLHIFTAAFFVLLKLSVAFSGALSSAFALIGLNFFSVCDPSDLMALSVLPFSFYIFPRIKPSLSLSKRRVISAAAIFLAGFASLATGTTPVPRTLSTYSANLMLSDLTFINATDESVNVQVMELSNPPRPDCSTLALGELRKEQFVSRGVWDQPSGEAASLLPVSMVAKDASCRVALLTVDDSENILLYWNSEDVPPREVPIVYGSDLHPSSIQAGSLVLYKEGKRFSLVLRGPVGINYSDKPVQSTYR